MDSRIRKPPHVGSIRSLQNGKKQGKKQRKTRRFPTVEKPGKPHPASWARVSKGPSKMATGDAKGAIKNHYKTVTKALQKRDKSVTKA